MLLTILLVFALIACGGGGFALRAAGGILSIFLYILAFGALIVLAVRAFG